MLKASLLDEGQLIRLHEAALAVLERVGLQVPHPEVLARFADEGAEVDFQSQRVRAEPELVMHLVWKAGAEFTLYGRDLKRTARFGQGQRNYNSIAGEAFWVDEPGGARRPARLADVATAARFAEGLERISVVGAMTDPSDVPVRLRPVEVFASLLRHTTRPVHFWFHDRASTRFLIELMVALRGSRSLAEDYPLCYPFLEPISPLRFPFDGVDLLFETAELNLPVPVGPMAQMGLSAPMSLAGTIVQEHAEILAGIAITQLIRPGLPVMYGGIPHAFDMRTTQLVFAGPEQALLGVAMTELGKWLGLPVYINVGLTDSKRPDAQAGLETAATLLPGAAAGADIFGHLGIAGVDQATSLDMLVLQHEVVDYVESVLREVDLSDEALGLAEIEVAGPGGGYLDRDFTADRFRSELWFPRLLDRQYYQGWLEQGALSLEERCRHRKAELLATSDVPPLADDTEQALEEVLTAARRELGG